MKKLFWLLILIGCTIPVESVPEQLDKNLYISFDKEVDSLTLMGNMQTFKVLSVKTNIPNNQKIKWESDIWVKVRIGVDSSYITNRFVIPSPYVDTVSTINCCSYPYNGEAKSVFGAFPMMRGQTATIVASVKIISTRSAEVIGILADTMKIVMY